MEANARKIFEDNLKYWMKRRNKEQADIARDLNINISTVSSWYNGKAYPRVDKMQMLSDYLNIPMRFLTDEREEKETLPDDFSSAEEALLWLAKQPVLAAYGGKNISDMSEEDQLKFARRILRYMRMESEEQDS